MKRLTSFLFFLAALAAPLSVFAEEPIQIGSEQDFLSASVCFVKEDAMKVLDALQESQEAADKVFNDSKQCTNKPITFKVGRVVYVVNVGTKFLKVVEITNPNDEKETLYWLTSKSIVKYKVDNNS